MGLNAYGDQNAEGGPYKSVAQIWQEATEQGANYRTLSAKHRYNVVKTCSGDDFIPDSDLKKVKSIGQGSFASGADYRSGRSSFIPLQTSCLKCYCHSQSISVSTKAAWLL